MKAKYGVPFDPTRLKSIKGFKFKDRVELVGYDSSGIPIGSQGTVWAISGYKGHSISPDPMHKMIYVNWDKYGFESVWISAVEKIANRTPHSLGSAPPVALSAAEKAIPGYAEDLESCVLQVKGKKGSKNPYAVCRSSLKKAHNL